MEELHKKHCKPCEGGTKPLAPHDVVGYMKDIDQAWHVSDENSNIAHEWLFKDFKQAMAFVNEVAYLAEEEEHHPDIYIFYNKVRLELSTHAVKGLSENDFILAAKVDRLDKEFIK